MSDDHVQLTIATYDRIASDYELTATPEMRAWEERSMRRFAGVLPGKKVLVPGCGDGRDSRYLSSLGLEVASFDLSREMLNIARAADVDGEYFLMDLRAIDTLRGTYDGIFASGCLYHVRKLEFRQFVCVCLPLLSPRGVLYFNMKEGQGEHFVERPGPRYPGGDEARHRLQGNRFYAYYQHGELVSLLQDFEIIDEQKLIPGDGGFEFWVRPAFIRPSEAASPHEDP